ncbi:TonB-dependent receptor [Candidatus Defluviicoccus seviourii]|uniref:TonB-dependent receptor n=1 Tax=Candidatus Defluviicoccus seviourii TaxID=2565273 RepID=A0A564WC84_9PROT|nr:TonB-dependent receptor [Candidatus Defluviicoccus seviourii]
MKARRRLVQCPPKAVRSNRGARAAAFGLVTACMTAMGAASPNAAEKCMPAAGRIASVEGSVEVSIDAGSIWRPAVLNELVCVGALVRVGANSRALVALANESILRLNEHTVLRMMPPVKTETWLVALVRGVIQFFSRQPRGLQVSTPYVNASVEGTEFLVQVDSKRTAVSVFEGVVAMTNDQGQIKLTSGESGQAEPAQAPARTILARPRDAVQWAIHYPDVLDGLADRSGRSAGSLPPAVQEAIALFHRGDISGALARLTPAAGETVAADEAALRAVYRAAILLSVGRVTDARTALDAARTEAPKDDGLADALAAIISVSQNDRAAALTEARRATEAGPRQAAPQIALSYALQASFELEAARDALLKAVAVEPDNALAWARLAELWLALGNVREARRAADRAEALSPDVERVQTVRGFAALAEIRTRAARAAFERAITLDPASPLPRFGLGLAKIRDGALEDGRADIEVAVGLDSERSLLRSYLGKAYYEERRETLAGRQYNIAKDMDPADPTPWFYSALLKQSENRPVEALSDLENSIRLNDNRAVYRSRALLDSDRASRQAGLARIYNDLGFSQLGQNEASRSLALDPASASAHRFLADTYAGVERREIARVSELLQAQLLQDININPVQPSMGDKRLNITAPAGPTRPGLNEFNSLFERNQVRLDVTGEVGNHSTYGNEAVVSGIYDQFSLSAGQLHYSTDGFRRNADITHNVYNVFGQAALSPEVNVQGEFRRRSTREGNLRITFDPEVYFADDNRDFNETMGRFGLRVSPSASTDIIASVIGDDQRENGLGYRIDGRIWQSETEILTRGQSWNAIAGAGGYRQDENAKVDGFPGRFDLDADQASVYAYGNVELPTDFVWTVGLAYDDFEQANLHHQKVSPKLGLQVGLNDWLDLRLAVFHTLKPALLADRTIQPTQVAGFNQFYDDTEGTTAWVYGVGLDARVASALHVGFEYTHRSIDEQIYDLTTERLNGDSREEDTARVYAYWTPHRFWALSAEVVYDVYDAGQGANSIVLNQVDTLSAPVSVRFFHPSGFFSTLTTTPVYQDSNGNFDDEEGSDTFVLVDAAIGYRFPKRRGQVSFEVTNLFNSGIKYQDDTYRTFGNESTVSPYSPERAFIGRLTLNF